MSTYNFFNISPTLGFLLIIGVLFVGLVFLHSAYGELSGYTAFKDVVKGSIVCIDIDYMPVLQPTLEAIVEWEYMLTFYTQSYGWYLNKLVNPDDYSECDIVINPQKYPEKYWEIPEDDIYLGYFSQHLEFKKIVSYYEKFWDNPQYKRIGKYPIPYELEDMPVGNYKTILKHELGHAFGLKHTSEYSIMQGGYGVRGIVARDLAMIVTLYGDNGWGDDGNIHTVLDYYDKIKNESMVVIVNATCNKDGCVNNLE